MSPKSLPKMTSTRSSKNKQKQPSRELKATQFSRQKKRARLTLVLKGMDKSITNLPPDAIAAEIERTITHAKVDDVYIMQKYNLIKVRHNSLTSANLIKERGLKLFAFSVTPSNRTRKIHSIQSMHTLL